MATSKTLTPTNVTIQIPAMTDAPDQSVNSNCIDKLGDAVNTLNSKLTPVSVAIVPDENIELFTNTSTALEVNGCFYIAVTGMAKVDIVNANLFTLSSNKAVRKSVVIPMGIGTSQWTNNESGYCYASSRSFVGTVPQGKWFHIIAMIPCA